MLQRAVKEFKRVNHTPGGDSITAARYALLERLMRLEARSRASRWGLLEAPHPMRACSCAPTLCIGCKFLLVHCTLTYLLAPCPLQIRKNLNKMVGKKVPVGQCDYAGIEKTEADIVQKV